MASGTAARPSKEMMGISEQERGRIVALRSVPAGKWAVLSQDETRIEAVADSFGEAAAQAEHLGLTGYVILKAPSRWLPLVAFRPC
jgi:hypothetical protein